MNEGYSDRRGNEEHDAIESKPTWDALSDASLLGVLSSVSDRIVVSDGDSSRSVGERDKEEPLGGRPARADG